MSTEKCKACAGTGRIDPCVEGHPELTEPCDACNGTGASPTPSRPASPELPSPVAGLPTVETPETDAVAGDPVLVLATARSLERRLASARVEVGEPVEHNNLCNNSVVEASLAFPNVGSYIAQLEAQLATAKEERDEALLQWKRNIAEHDVIHQALAADLAKANAAAEEAKKSLVFWKDGYPPKPYDQEWFLAVTKYRDRVVLTALPEEFSYDFKTADDTYIKKENIVKWAQFPTSEYRTPLEDAEKTITELRAQLSAQQSVPPADSKYAPVKPGADVSGMECDGASYTFNPDAK